MLLNFDWTTIPQAGTVKNFPNISASSVTQFLSLPVSSAPVFLYLHRYYLFSYDQCKYKVKPLSQFAPQILFPT